jgi:hypothetical protein
MRVIGMAVKFAVTAYEEFIVQDWVVVLLVGFRLQPVNPVNAKPAAG